MDKFFALRVFPGITFHTIDEPDYFFFDWQARLQKKNASVGWVTEIVGHPLQTSGDSGLNPSNVWHPTVAPVCQIDC